MTDPFVPVVIKDGRTYRCVATPEGLDELCTLVRDHGVVAFDWETTTATRWSPEFQVLGLAIAVSENAGYYIPINHELPAQRQLFQQTPPSIDFDLICRKLGPLLETRLIVCHHAGFDIPVAKQVGMPVSSRIYDTYIAAGVTNDTRERRLGLKELTRNWLGREVTELTDVTGNKKIHNMKWSPIDLVTEYAAADACNTIALHEVTAAKLKCWSHINQIYEKIEMPIVPVIAQMEAQGFLIDQPVLKDIHQRATADCAKHQKTMSKLAGYPFDPKKAEHARHMLFDKLCIPVAWKQGKESADRKQLELSFRLLDKAQQKKAKPFFDAYVGHSKADKVRSTYTNALLDRLDHNGKIHPSFLQVATYTGRFSSRGPNFTNLPRDDEEYDVRAAFIPDPGHVFVVADMVQVEFKIAAALSQDPTLVQAANDPSIDVHVNTARVCFDISESREVEKQERQDAKTLTYAVQYGATPAGLARLLQIAVKRAGHIINGFYNKAYPGLRDWIKAMQELIIERGYSETHYGRRRWADVNALQSKDLGLRSSELRKLTNAIAQGTAADLIKLAMRDIQCWLLKEGLLSRMVGQIHDELILHCPIAEAPLVLENVKRLMTSVLLGVTLSVDGSIRSSLSKSDKAVVELN
jgi:DNA polymerase-1